MIESKVSNKIYLLGKTVRDNLKDFNDFREEEAREMSELYTKTQGEIGKYDKGITQMSWNTEYIVKSEKLITGADKYIERLGKKHPIVKKTVDSLINQLEYDESRASSLLTSLIHFLIFKEGGKYSDERLVEITTIYLNDLRNVAPDWNIKLWINGIWLKEKDLKISNEFSIHQPVNEDYYILKPAWDLMSRFHADPTEMCSAIIRLNLKGKNQNEISEYIDSLVKSLTLFRLGSVQVIRREYNPNSILSQHGTPGSMNDTTVLHKYELLKSESKNLESFSKSIFDFLPDRNWQNEDSSKNSIFLAIERYMEAVNKRQATESRITNIITCLEALLLKTMERSELSHKLSQRASLLLSISKTPPIKIYSVLKRAYNVRSTFIHGSMLKPDEKKDLNDISKEIADYARICLLIFIDLSEKYDKDELVSKIDNSLLDKGANEKLLKELKSLELIKITAHNKK